MTAKLIGVLESGLAKTKAADVKSNVQDPAEAAMHLTGPIKPEHDV